MTTVRVKCTDGIEQDLTLEEVRKRYLAGELPRSAMSWVSGERHWISLGSRWPSRQSSSAPSAIAIAASWTAILVAGVITFGDLEMGVSPWQGFWLSSAIRLLALGIAATAMIWAWRRALGRKSVGLVVSAMTLGLTTVVVLPIMSLSHDVQTHRAAGELAQITIEDLGSTVAIEGEIDGSVSSRLRAILQQQPNAKTLVLDSPGGFIDEAFSAADLVREHGLVTRIDGRCYSACVVIWASATKREITVRSTVGLHQSSNKLSVPASWKEAAQINYDSRYDLRLKQGGFPTDMLAKGRETQASDMYLVTALELAEAKVPLSVVDDDGAPISMAFAQLIDVVSDLDSDNPMMLLIRQLADREPGALETFGPRLAAAKATGDMAAAQVVGSEVTALGKAYVLENASDEGLVSWINGLLRVHQKAVAADDEETCRLLAGQLSAGKVTAKQADLGMTVTQQLVDVIHSIPTPPPGYSRVPSSEARTAFDNAVVKAYHARLDAGGSEDVAEWTGLESCKFTIQLYEELLAHSPKIAAGAIRLGELGE